MLGKGPTNMPAAPPAAKSSLCHSPAPKLSSHKKSDRVRGPRGCKRKKLKETLPGETPATQRVDTDSYPYIIPPPAPAPKKFYAHRNAEDMFSYELNPLMSRMIDVELQDVMIKVWQSLPDEPNSDAEKLVAEKFRTDVGDTFRNVLGLNIAKRLLNIFNKLMLKIQFSAMPARANLRAFLKKYSFVSFKRIVGTTKSFHAQVKTVQDFDWLCTSKELYCGTSKVTVTPHYKFIQRPDKLKTTFNKSNVEKPKTDVASEKDVKETSKDDTQDKKEEVKSVVKEVAKTTQAETTIQAKPATTNTQNKPAQVKTTTAKNVPKTTQNAKEAKPNEEAPVKNNASATTNTNSNMSKTTQNTKEANKVAVKPNLTATKPNTRSYVPKTAQNTKEAKPNEVAPVKTNTTAIKAPVTTTPAKTAQAKTNTPTTATQNKPDTKVTPEAKPNTPQAKTNASANKTPIAKSAPQAKPKVNQKTTPNQVKPTKTIAKVKVPAKAQEMKKKSPNTKTKKNPLQGKGDFEELDDYDILALMSGGIVLDECSGSDVE